MTDAVSTGIVLLLPPAAEEGLDVRPTERSDPRCYRVGRRIVRDGSSGAELRGASDIFATRFEHFPG